MAKFSPDYITRLFRNQVENNHRTIFVVVGEGSKLQIPSLHSKLSSVSELTNIVWCYKNVETSLDRESKKAKANENDTDFDAWIKTTNIDHISYKETSKLLGRTCDMLVLQDFESVTANTIACAFETVRGGGAIILLFDMDKSIKEIISSKSEFISEMVAEKSVPRFNRRLFKFLINFQFAVFLDSKLRVMSITTENHSIEVSKPLKQEIPTQVEITDTPLYRICKTKDQLDVLKYLLDRLDSNEPSITSVQAGRGRGKSAAMGLAIVGAIERKLPLVLVSSLFLDNVQSIFEFVISGLEALEYRKMKDYKVNYIFRGKQRSIRSIEITKDFRRTVEFVQCFDDIKIYPSLLVIDEAAAIPLPSLKRLLDTRLVFMASTSSGYEGTGRVFRTKLTEYLREKTIKTSACDMKEPIRYGVDDEVESWLNATLLLEPKISKVQECPMPSECVMYFVNKDALFSGNVRSEEFLNEIFSLFVASHYRNSPNDIQILSDSPNHEIFVLMTPSKPHRVLCAIQVSFEGKCSRSSFTKEGNLIPWVIYDNFNDTAFLNELGIRIVRIAVHQDVLSMGYGSMALNTIMNVFRRDNGVSENTSTESESQILSPDKTVLFHPTDKIKIPKISWIGASFAVSERLINFWKRSGFSPICIKQTPSKTTGEFSVVVMKQISDVVPVSEMNMMFIQKFVVLLSYSFRDISPTLALSLIYSSDTSIQEKQILLSNDEIRRLRLFSQRNIDIYGIMDILPDVTRLYFYKNNVNVSSVVAQTALLMIGGQHQKVDLVAKYLDIDYFRVVDLIASAVEAVLNMI